MRYIKSKILKSGNKRQSDTRNSFNRTAKGCLGCQGKEFEKSQEVYFWTVFIKGENSSLFTGHFLHY